MFLALKDVGSIPVAKYLRLFFLFCFQFASFFVFILDFLHNWIYLFESGMRLCITNKYSTVNKFNRPTSWQSESKKDAYF